MLFEGDNRLLYEQRIFDESQHLENESKEIIMRGDDSFTSKQTNEYLQDILKKHNLENEDSIAESVNRISLPYKYQNQRMYPTLNR